MSFVHLHTHSEYSLLDGANRIDDLIERTAALGMPAVALTDHGNMYGAWEFQEKARARGIRPIIGCEAYVAYGDRRSKRKPEDAPAESAHLVLLAQQKEGYRNLVKLTSIGFTEGFYRRPRIDRQVLAEHADGLIVLSACLASELARWLKRGRYDRAREAAEFYARTFPERYWLEVQDHGIDGQREVNEGIFTLADELGLPVLVTNDAHYLRREDADAHDTLLCIGTGKDKNDPDRLRFHGSESYFKSPEEMAALFPDRPELLSQTLEVAERCDVRFESSYHLPGFPLPEEFRPEGAADAQPAAGAADAEPAAGAADAQPAAGAADAEPAAAEARARAEAAYLRQLAHEGARERYGDPLPEAARTRLEYELDVITQTGYSGYFLIVWDFIRAAREMEIPVGPGRGSAAGSIVAYALHITDIDPLRFDLLFERFLNPERVSMPDIDIDFCYERRGEIIDYVRSKYGADSVGQIITFGTMKARAAVRDVGRVLGFTPAETDRLAKLIPSGPGFSLSVSEAVERVPEVKELYDGEPRYARLLDYARRVEGLARHSSVHAAGVVIAPGPLDEYVPVATDTRNGDSAVVTQYDMSALEKAGMLKMDFLGLRTLTVIQDAARAVEERHGVHIDWDEIGLDDPEVYRMLAGGGTAGSFQFESALATEKLRAMRCDRFDDLIAVNALIRPGPLDSGMTDVYIRRKRGREPVTYPHQDLKPVLEPTYGIFVYQEQVMRAANLLAGFSLAEADVLRKAVGKKDAELTDTVLRDFRQRSVERGVAERTAREIADLIRTFGRYGFNRAHSAAYALLSYRTAWLKAHWPAEFMAALLSSEIGNTDRVVGYIATARELGIEVLPPGVNGSGYKFTVVRRAPAEAADSGLPAAGDRPDAATARENGGRARQRRTPARREPGTDASPAPARVRFGLGAIRGAGHSAIRSIIAAREDGPFQSLFDFCQRIDLRLNNRRVLECLIRAGALDDLGDRAALEAGLDAALGEAQLRQRERESGQASLFGGDGAVERREPTLPDADPWPEAERLKREKEVIGFYISGHPLDRFRDLVDAYAVEANTSMLEELRDRKVEVACVVTGTQVRVSRRDGREWCRLTIEDFHGAATALAFGDVWLENRALLAQDAPVLIAGSVSGNSRDEEDPPLFVDSVRPLSELRGSERIGIRLELDPEAELAPDAFERAGRLLRDAPGPAPVYVAWRMPAAEVGPTPGAEASPAPAAEVGPTPGAGANGATLLQSATLRVAPGPDLVASLREIFGPGRVRLVRRTTS